MTTHTKAKPLSEADIKPYTKNAKKHPEKQLLALAKIVQEVGWRQPVLVNLEGVIIAGHGRWMAYLQFMEEYSLPTIWVVDTMGRPVCGRLDARPMSPEQESAYRFADNKLNESEWDMDLALPDLKLLPAELFDLTGFDHDLLIDPDEKDDEVPETPTKARSKPGDLYELGPHRLLCGDATSEKDMERLMAGYHAQRAFEEAVRANGYLPKAQIIWEKPSATMGWQEYRNRHELIFYCVKDGSKANFYGDRTHTTIWKQEPTDKALLLWLRKQIQTDHKGTSSIWVIGREKVGEYEHPTQKPVELVKRAIVNSSKEDDIILDTFLGSGSTLITAEKCGRACYGTELDPRYVDVIVERYVQYADNRSIIKNGNTHIWQPLPSESA